jgi:hypothetical protein
MTEAGLESVTSGSIVIEVPHDSFHEWWEPFTFGVGPAGAYLSTVDESVREQLRQRCLADLGEGPFVLRATAWTAIGVIATP